MVEHHIVYRLHSLKLRLQLVQVGLKYLNLHVVHVVFAELKHAVSQGVRLLEDGLYVTLLGGLVLEPHLLQMFLGIFALKQVSEDQLILVDSFLGDDQGQRPAHLVI